MTQGEKQLLLKDLCARLPYQPKLQIYYEEMSGSGVFDEELWEIDGDGQYCNGGRRLEDIKPYLRPMSSMTDKEETLFRCELPAIAKTDAQLVAMRMELFLKGHLDFNHLIEKGLALKAPDDMYKTE